MENRPPGAVVSRCFRREPAANIRTWLSALLLVSVLVSCRNASRDDKISARDDTGFELWISDHNDVLSPAEIKELNTARQQIRYKVMQARPGLSSADLSAAVYEEINGLTANELLRNGYALQIQRLKTDLLNYQTQLERFQAHEQDSHLSAEKKEVVAEALAKLRRLMQERQDELARFSQKLTQLDSDQTPANAK
jgi:hypothetical protein